MLPEIAEPQDHTTYSRTRTRCCRAIAKTEAYEDTRRQRKKVEMAFEHLKRILKMGRLRLRGPTGVQDEFTLAAIAQNLRKMAKLMEMPKAA